MIATLDWSAWVTLALLVTILLVLAVTRLPVDMVFLAALTVLLLFGILEPAEAFAGLANQGVLAVGALYVVVAGIRDTGAIQWISRRVLGAPRTPARATARMALSAAGLSAFLNNTPVVAMLIPAVSDWAERLRVPESRLLMPLSFAAILGGMCTLIGTSTNLVINGLLVEHTGNSLGLFSITPVGLPVALICIAVIVVLAPRLLPDRRTAREQFENVREYTMEMLVTGDGGIDGATIEDAALRHLPGCYLVELIRDGEVSSGIGPTKRLHAGDRLVFVGSVDAIVRLQGRMGLRPADEQVFKLDAPDRARRLVEAVVSDQSPVIGKSVRASEFRNRYNAVILSVSRQGQRLSGRVGDIELAPGDTLLLEAAPQFMNERRTSRDFLLTREISGSTRPNPRRAMTALAILVAMAASVAVGLVPLLEGALVASGLMLATRCLSVGAAREAIDWSLIVTIAASIGLGAAVQQTGLADVIAYGLQEVTGDSIAIGLGVIVVGTALLSLMITNNAAAVLIFPVAMGVAASTGGDPAAFAIACMIGASASFMTPFGYQTNLMVMGPGGYRFSDYLALGGVVTVVAAVVGVALITTLWG